MRATVSFCSLLVLGSLSVACGSEDSPRSTSTVRINELQSRGTSYTDPADSEATPDWIELYNTGAEVVDLAGYFLSDDSEDLMKFTFTTDAKFDAGGWLVVMADGATQVEQGPLHVGFKLSATSGDRVFLTDPDGYLVDEIEFGAPPDQTTNYSFARFPDGTGAFSWCAAPTAAKANGSACAL
jgi:hypothetical protein